VSDLYIGGVDYSAAAWGNPDHYNTSTFNITYHKTEKTALGYKWVQVPPKDTRPYIDEEAGEWNLL